MPCNKLKFLFAVGECDNITEKPFDIMHFCFDTVVWWVCSVPLPSSSNNDYLEDKREDYQNCSVLWTTVVHNDTHTHTVTHI